MTSFDDAVAKIKALPRDARGRMQWGKHPIEVAAFAAAAVAAPKRAAWAAAAAEALGISYLSSAISRFARGLTADGAEWPELRAELVRLGVLLAKPAPKVDPSRAVVSIGGVPIKGAAQDAEPARPATRRETIAAGADLVVTETRVLAYGTPEHKSALIELLRGLKIGSPA